MTFIHKSRRTNVLSAIAFIAIGIGIPSHAQDIRPAMPYEDRIRVLAELFATRCSVTPVIEEKFNMASGGFCTAVSLPPRVATERCVPANLFVFYFCGRAIIEGMPKETLSRDEIKLLLSRDDVLSGLIGQSIRYYLDSNKTDYQDVSISTPHVFVEYRQALFHPKCFEIKTTTNEVLSFSDTAIISTGGQTAWRRKCPESDSK